MADTWNKSDVGRGGNAMGMEGLRKAVKKARKKKGLTKKISNAEKELFKLIK